MLETASILLRMFAAHPSLTRSMLHGPVHFMQARVWSFCKAPAA